MILGILQVGSADHHIHYYDLRNISQPLYVFRGHRKTVSYVKFLSSDELASSSTDSTLRLWDVKENLAVSYGPLQEKRNSPRHITSTLIAFSGIVIASVILGTIFDFFPWSFQITLILYFFSCVHLEAIRMRETLWVLR